MKVLSLFLVLMGFSQFSFAETEICRDKMNALTSRETKRGIVGTEDYRRFYPAVAHYRKEIETDRRPYIKSIMFYFKGHQLRGYRVEITDGGDESLVRYYFDKDLSLIYAKWENQTPIQFWFCGKKLPDEIML